MNENARKIYRYFQFYKMYLEVNNLDDDSSIINVGSLINFVETQLSKEDIEGFLVRNQ